MIINEKIIGDRIYLRTLTLKDASERYCSWLNNSEVNKYLETRKATIEDLKKYIEEKNNSKNCIFLGIFDNKNDKHIGNTKLELIDFENKRATFSILIGDTDYWGKGIGTEVTELFVNYGFYYLNLLSIDLGVIPENKAAVRTYEKVGFKVKETKSKTVNHDGKFFDSLIMEINKKKLCLGTVQLGLEYGINNSYGKPSNEESIRILEYVFNHGIKIIDTAAAYGDAEKIIGEFIRKNKLQNKIFIVSKLMPNIFSGEESEEELTKIIEAEVRKSLKKLEMHKIYGYLIHKPEYIYNNKVVSGLLHCKKINLIDNFGVSICEKEEALYAANLPVDFIQVPYNLFDQRLDKTDFFKLCKKNKITVFARSPFLQGLILMDKEKVPEHLEEASKYIEELENILKEEKISKVEASLLFSYKHPGIDYVVFGIDNEKQLKENIKIMEKNIDFEGIFKKLTKSFVGIQKGIVSPGLWKKQ